MRRAPWLALVFSAAFAVSLIALVGRGWGKGHAPMVLDDSACAGILGGADCSPGDTNCACVSEACSSTSDCTADVTCALSGSGTCVKLVTSSMTKCGQVNTAYPNGCTQSVDGVVKCGEYWTGPPQYPYNTCSYPWADQCNDSSDTYCGANWTQCQYN